MPSASDELIFSEVKFKNISFNEMTLILKSWNLSAHNKVLCTCVSDAEIRSGVQEFTMRQLNECGRMGREVICMVLK